MKELYLSFADPNNWRNSAGKEKLNKDGWRKTLKDSMPSKCTSSYWIFVFAPHFSQNLTAIHRRIIEKKMKLKEDKLRTGKWLIFVDRKNVDEIWSKIKRATEEGILGIEAKVSTAKPKPKKLRYQENKHVICVYTREWTDKNDVMRVREELRESSV
jgi:hypothetical protein